MERCLFVDFPFFNKYFDHELDFSWKNHAKRLLEHGHNASAPENIPERIPYGYTTIADVWMFKDMREYFDKYYGVEMWKDLDWSAALLQSNPIHQVRTLDQWSVAGGFQCPQKGISESMGLWVCRLSIDKWANAGLWCCAGFCREVFPYQGDVCTAGVLHVSHSAKVRAQDPGI
jgi:hypothetical protein